MITVYTKSNCVQCEQTKKWLDRNGLEFTTVDIEASKEAYDYVIGLGYAAAPVVETGAVSWSGFRLDKLKGLINE